MSSSLIGLARNLNVLAARLRIEAAEDDGALRRRFGGTLVELRMMRDCAAAKMVASDPRHAELAQVDAALAELAGIFAALPRAALSIQDAARPVRRRREQRVARLDTDTRKLLKRAALVLGVSGSFALPLAAAAGSCTVGSAIVCTGDFAAGIYNNTVNALTVESLIGNIAPASGTRGIVLERAGTEGSHDGFGDSGDGGGTAPDTAIITSAGTSIVSTTGDDAHGILSRSAGGGGGNGGDGAVGISPGTGGGGGAGGTAAIDNSLTINTSGIRAAGLWALSQGGSGGAGGDDYLGSGGASGGAGGNAGLVTITNRAGITTGGAQAFGIFGQSIGGNGGQAGGSNGSFNSAGSGGGANKGNTVTIDNQGAIVTTGDDSHGIFGESVGGFGGSGGSAVGLFGWGGSGSTGGDAGAVNITNSNAVTTGGARAYGIFAQSVGGGGGNGGTGVGIVGLGAGGNIGGSGSTVSVTNSGTINTGGADARGIFAQSIGGGGGNGGAGAGIAGVGGSGSGTSPGGNVSVGNSGAITTKGVNAHAIEAQSIGGGGGDGGLGIGIIGIGGKGAAGGDAGTVTISNTGTLATAGSDASAVFAQSIGGGGGNGGNAFAVGVPILTFALGGEAGPGGKSAGVSVTSKTGSIDTTGARSSGVFAQSIGGGGGNGGFAISASAGPYFSAAIGIGGSGGEGGAGGTALIDNESAVTTSGASSAGLFAQSIGGGGGNGGFALALAGSDGVAASFAVGGKGDKGGASDKVTLINKAKIVTGGLQSNGIVAQSIGGGGGNGGLAISGAAAIIGSLGFGIGGAGAGGGAGSAVNLTNSGEVSTGGESATAVLAQSIGGGGGNGGGAVAGSFAQTANFTVGVGGGADIGGDAGAVTLKHDGKAITAGANAMGVVAQSIGGGGGNGGFSVGGTLAQGYAAGISVGGKGLGGGSGSAVSLTGNGSVNTGGLSAIGMLAQSIGGGGGNGGFSVAGTIAKDAAATFAIGGNSGNGGAGGNVTVDTTAAITTKGDLAYGLLAQSIGGGGGTGGFAISGQISGGSTIGGISLALGGTGGPGGNGGIVDLKSGGDIKTSGVGAHGVTGQSIGGGGGNGGFAGSFVASLKDGATANFAVGGKGGVGGSGAKVAVNTFGTVTTAGKGAYGVFAQSIGGGGGDGGWGLALSGSTAADNNGTLVAAIGGNGGTGGLGGQVDLTNSADVITQGSNAYGLLAQSVGGGGGNGGFAASGAFSSGSNSKTLNIGVGGQGGTGNHAGNVSVINSGKISTTGNTPDLTSQDADNSIDKTHAIGILAQSIGGGGGNGGASISGTIGGADAKTLAVNVGGFGGAGGKGADATVTNLLGGSIETEGAFGYGIQAQSVGGGGGNGGMALSAIFGMGGEGTNANIGVTVGGEGGDGNSAALAKIDNAGGITTRGAQSAALAVESIGGGGGNGGAAVTAIMGVTSKDPSQSQSRTVNMAVAVGGKGGDGSHGGQSIVKNSGVLTSWGSGAQGIKAQSIGGGGGTGGNSNTISLQIAAACTLPLVCKTPDNAARNVNLQASVGGNGGGASNGGTVDVDNSGVIVTYGELADGILAQSIGGGGGLGGNGVLGTGGLLPFPVEVVFIPVGQTPIYQDISLAVGGNAGSSGNGGAVTVLNSGRITTSGSNAIAINAQSVGGGGGAGGIAEIGVTGKVGIGGKGGAGGNGGAVSVTNKAALTTSGIASYGVFAQSVGGGGGRAGNVNRGFAGLVGSQYGFGIGLAFGQAGGDGGDGANVTVDNQSSISTGGEGALGIFAQSVGGGGGQLGNIGNFDVVGLAGFFVGSVGDRGNGGLVTLKQSGDVTTMGSGATGIFAQSAGGQGTGEAVTVDLRGSISTEGKGAGALIAQSAGLNGAGNIGITGNGNVTTKGDDAIGILAQSLGAASAEGSQGKAITTVTPIQTNNYILPFLTGMARAGNISIEHTGSYRMSGARSHGIVAQSVSSMGAGGAIKITFDGSITAEGVDADGIVAQSRGIAASATDPTAPFPNQSATAVPNNGDIAITINGNGTVSGGSGEGAAVRFIDGNNNTLINRGTLTTARGVDGVTVIGGGGNETFDNYGTLIGRVQLGGGTNLFRNHAGATLAVGAVLDLGGSTLDNAATFSPGNTGNVITTTLTGSYNQPASGVFLVDVAFGNVTADRLNATGSASVNGTLLLNFNDVGVIKPGTSSFTILSAAGGTTNAGLHIGTPNSAVATYGLSFPNVTDAVVTLDVNFAPVSGLMNANDGAIGAYINAIQTAGSTTALAPTIQAIFALPGTQELHDFYQALSPEPMLAGQQAVQAVGATLTNAMLSCHPAQGGAWRFTDEAECSWMRATPTFTNIDATASTMGSIRRAVDIAAGHQFRVNDVLRIGIAGSYSTGTVRVGDSADGHGDTFAGGLVFKGLFEPVEVALAVTGGMSVNHTNRFLVPGVVASSRRQDSFVNERLRLSTQLFGEDDFYVRPFAEVNLNQLFTGAFHETGAGPLNLFGDIGYHVSGEAAAGLEFGGEIDIEGVAVLRPFIGYEFRHNIMGRTMDIQAAFEGAPGSVVPFTVSTTPDVLLHQATAGFDFITNENWNLRFLYTGSFGAHSRQDSFSLKVAIPF